MKYTKYALFAILIIAVLTITACSEEQINNDTKEPTLDGDVDEYDCETNTGYTWCPSLSECVQVWETQCPEYEEYYKEPVACTMEYMPVTGELIIPTQDGEITIIKEFSNRCVAEAAGATNIVSLTINQEPINKYELCEAAEGTPLPNHGECEYISESICQELEGEFYNCESACRHDPDAEMCIEVCVPVCKFN